MMAVMSASVRAGWRPAQRHSHLGGGEAAATHAAGVEAVAPQGQTGQLPSQGGQGEAGVHQRGEDHVAAGAREAV